LTRYLRQTAMNVSRNVQEMFGTTEAVVNTRPDPTPQHENGARSGDQAHAHSRASGKGDRLPPRERRGRD
jgi:hypothetical protein